MAHKTVFPGIQGLVSSGSGTKKTVKPANLPRPESAAKNVVDKNAGAKKSGKAPVQVGGSAKKIVGSGHKGIHVGLRPEPMIKRDGASALKSFGNK